nr:protein dopey-1 isoform X2 [Ciona intestinalis]|eukprot:XP_026690200.1 protein dopey-1 isoform X2 [Ciona intestinalis]
MMSSEEQAMLDDSKYRQYMNAVEKCLRNFESSSEWADLISALGKLNKVLNSKFKVIPKKITIGKRLAQCMHPALPGGVHLKAINVYDSIFKIIAPDLLKADLYIYSLGIFPLFSNASLQVRPVLLNLYETHMLPLGESLRTCLDGMILGLLPGLDEGTEHFERTDLLLERVCERVGAFDFYSAIWRCVLSSPSARLSAVQLVLRKFDRKRSTEDQLFIIGSDLEVMVTALCQSLQDNVVLTQRASLDVLILCCPLSNLPILYTDACILLEAALQCLLRRDMSLNRRLYSWLLGVDQSKQSSVSSLESSELPTFFEKYSKQMLIESLVNMLSRQTEKISSNTNLSVIEELYPLRILVSLLDKTEVGPVIIERVLLHVFRLLKAAVEHVKSSTNYRSTETSENDKRVLILGEISKTANLLLGVFEPTYIWKYLSNILISETDNEQCESTTSYSEICQFIHLLLSFVDLESYAEIQTVSLPTLMCHLTTIMTSNIGSLSNTQLYDGLTTCNVLLKHSQPLQPNITASETQTCETSGSSVSDCAKILLSFLECFVDLKLNHSRININNYLKILEADNEENETAKEASQTITTFIDSTEYETKSEESMDLPSITVVDVFKLTCNLLLDFACFPVYCNGQKQLMDKDQINSSISTFPSWLQCLLWCACGASNQLNSMFSVASTSISTILDLLALTQSISPDAASETCSGTISVKVLSPLTSSHVHILTEESKFYKHITKQLWRVIGEAIMNRHHLTCVQLLLRLHSMCPDSRCENVLLADIIHHNKVIRFSAFEKFCRLWHLTRALTSQKINLQSGTHVKLFTRCLFSLVDQLSLNQGHLGSDPNLFQLDPGGESIGVTTASTWLRRSLEEKDLSRILEPFFMVLLHPCTHSSPKITKPNVSCNTTSLETVKSSGHEQMVEFKNCPPTEDKISKGEMEHQFTTHVTPTISSVTVDITTGKEKYKQLLLTLTTDAGHDLERQAREVVTNVIHKACQIVSSSAGFTAISTSTHGDTKPALKRPSKETNAIGPVLVYQEKFDAFRVSYALRSILNMFHAHPRLFAYTASTQPLATNKTTSGASMLQELLARHLQSMGGESFYDDVTTRYPNIMILEVLIIISLRYIRSWGSERLISFESLHDVRSVACTLLVALLDQMTILARDNVVSSAPLTSSSVTSSATQSSQQFGAYVWSLLEKYKVNETVLLSLSATVDALHVVADGSYDYKTPNEDILLQLQSRHAESINSYELAFWWSGGEIARVKSFQSNLLSLVRSLLVFQYYLSDANTTTSLQDWQTHSKDSDPKYHPRLQISVQPLLSSALIRVLALQMACDVHGEWLDFVTSSLQFLPHMLSEVTSPITLQLCRNLKDAATMYSMCSDHHAQLPQMPPDYVISSLKSLRTLSHFTLLLHASTHTLQHSMINTGHVLKADKASQLNSLNTSVALNQANNVGLSALGSLFNVFSVSSSIKTQRSVEEQELSVEVTEARRVTLRNLPRILSCLVTVWHKVVSPQPTGNRKSKQHGRLHLDLNPCVAMGGSESVSRHVLQLLDPLAIQFGENLVSAFAIVWERRDRTEAKKSIHWFPLPEPNIQQQQILDVACAIRSLQCDVILGVVKRVILQPNDFPLPSSNKRRKPFQESLLDFTLRFLQRQTSSAVRDAWPNLLSLVRECLALGPVVAPTNPSISGSNATLSGKLSVRCHFFLLLLVSEYARRAAGSSDKKDQKDLQDICVKCIEACNAIVDCSLEHGGWLARRAPSVIPGPHQLKDSKHKLTESGSSVDLMDSKSRPETAPKTVTSDPGLATTRLEETGSSNTSMLPQANNPNFIHSLHALNVLAQVLANLLDVIYGSEEKDKIVPVLTPVMTNVTPYLKNHSANNAPSYKAAVRLLSSVSGYQQTRRAWKREAFELLMDNDFFRMPLDCAIEWGNVVDHLMTHDATTFKELMVRIGLTRNAATGPSLNIFSNKEQELEQRAMLLKRLAFVIFSSDTNQYQRHLPEIQERLSESLKLHQVPAVQAQVFLCFRVLLLRVSPNNLQSLWPSIVTELVQVLSQLEQQLTLHSFENDSLRNSDFDNPTATSSGGGILFSGQTNISSVYSQEKWMAMYLSACKLLDLILCLQPTQLCHFKLFRWSFVGEPGENVDDVYDDVTNSKPAEDGSTHNSTTNEREFVPHCVRIKRLLARKSTNGGRKLVNVEAMRPLLEMNRLTSLWQLQNFFNTLVEPHTMLAMHRTPNQFVPSNTKDSASTFRHIETILQKDFVESMT